MTKRRQATFKDLVKRWAATIGAQPERVQVQRMTRKWASCSPAGRLSFSAGLIREERAFQEIVIVHELLHLRVPNHGRLFKSLMTAYLPEWERIGGHRIARVCRYSANSARKSPQ
ncbi:MAG: M48 metallopeptidase family protein [Candidatus Rokuibacteriota bacterium]